MFNFFTEIWNFSTWQNFLHIYNLRETNIANNSRNRQWWVTEPTMNQKNSSGSTNCVFFYWFCLVRQHLPCQQRYNFEFAIFSQIVSQTQIYFEGPVFDSFIAMLVLYYGYDNDWQLTLNIQVLSAFDNVFVIIFPLVEYLRVTKKWFPNIMI